MLASLLAVMALAPAPFVNTSPELGKAEGQCRANESGPAFMVDVVGIKNRNGWLKLEVYPANDQDFLADDNVLINAGKVFRRIEITPPANGPIQMCVRVPAPGTYSLVLLHDVDKNHKFGFAVDGIGFASNPKLGWSRPKSAATRATAGSGVTPISIVLNYRRGLGMRPLD